MESYPRAAVERAMPLTESTAATGKKERTEDQLLTVDEVTTRLSVSRNWVYNHADAIGGYFRTSTI